MKLLAVASLLALVAVPAHALYKVVGPDGKVTYTDRPQADQGRAVPLGRPDSESSEEVSLPIVLREAVARFPVTLYTTTDCQPCDAARALLRQRGVPFRERIAGTTAADNEAWLRATGGMDSPTLSIGNHVMRGFAPAAWNTYLDTAGYPRESRLPTNYVAPRATPLVEPTAPREAASPKAAPMREPDVAPAPSGGFRF